VSARHAFGALLLLTASTTPVIETTDPAAPVGGAGDEIVDSAAPTTPHAPPSLKVDMHEAAMRSGTSPMIATRHEGRALKRTLALPPFALLFTDSHRDPKSGARPPSGSQAPGAGATRWPPSQEQSKRAESIRPRVATRWPPVGCQVASRADAGRPSNITRSENFSDAATAATPHGAASSSRRSPSSRDAGSGTCPPSRSRARASSPGSRTCATPPGTAPS